MNRYLKDYKFELLKSLIPEIETESEDYISNSI